MPHSLPYFLLYSLLISLKPTILAQKDTDTNSYIVALIDADTRIGKEQKTAMEIAITDVSNNPASVKLSLTFQNSSGDPFTAATTVEELTNQQQVTAIIGPSTWQETALVADIGSRMQVPVLSFATAAVNTPLMSLRWPYLVRMMNSDSIQMKCIAAIVESYKWRKVIALYEDNSYVGGDSGAITLLSDALRYVGSELEARYSFPPLSSLSGTIIVIRDLLGNLSRERCKVFVMVAMPLPLAAVIFAEAKKLDMMEKGYVWITTDGVTSLLDSVDSSVISSMEGVVGIKTYFNESRPSTRGFWDRFRRHFSSEYPEEEKHEPSIYALRAYDAVSVVYRSLVANMKQRQTLVSGVLSSAFMGLSGDISFKDGELDQVPVFRIINVIGNIYKDVGFWSPKLGFSEKFNGRNKALGRIYWPGGPEWVPKGWASPTGAMPMRIGLPRKTTFGEFVTVDKNFRNGTDAWGFCIEVFREVEKLLPYELQYHFKTFEGTSYNDLVQQVYLKNFDAVVGDTTILANRSQYVEFTQPYIESALSMVVLTESKDSRKAWMFMKPFTTPLWVVTGTIFVYTGIVVWVLEHRENPDFRGPWPSQIGTLIWFTFSTLFFAHRERLQSNFTRIVIMVWLFVAFVLTSSYTASLTSILTVERIGPKVTDIEVLKRSNAKVGCDRDSFLWNFLIDVLQFKPENMKPVEHGEEEVAAELRSGNISAAFLESPYANVLLGRHCKGYTTTGPSYRFGGFGFVFPQGSPLVDDVSKAILSLSETGILKTLEDKLFSSSKCARGGTNIDGSGSLGLDNFWGLFVITGATSTIILILFIVDLIRKFRKHCDKFEGNVSPSDESIWKQMVILAQYFHKGQLHPLQKPSISSLADEDVWYSMEYVSEKNTPEHPQSSPMPIEGPKETS